MKKENLQKESLQIICLISEAALTVASGAFSWAAPAATLLGLSSNLMEKYSNKIDYIKEYKEAIKSALGATKKEIKKSSQLQILEELSKYTGELDDLKTIIQKTESYRQTYSTKKDINEIVAIFDEKFRIEVSKHTCLSNFYILKSSWTTLDMLKRINYLIEKDHQIISGIADDMSVLKKMGKKITILFYEFVNIVISSIIAFSFFLISSSIFKVQYKVEELFCILGVIVTSDVLINIFSHSKNNNFCLRLFNFKINNSISTVIIQCLIATAFFLITENIINAFSPQQKLCAIVSVVLGIGVKLFYTPSNEFIEPKNKNMSQF